MGWCVVSLLGQKASRKSLQEMLPVATYKQTPDAKSFVLFRMTALSGAQKTGENCALDEPQFGLDTGTHHNAEPQRDVDASHGVKDVPAFKVEGIVLLHGHVKNKDGKVVKHFYGLDARRRLIYDSGEDMSVCYCGWDEMDMKTSGTAKDHFAGLGLYSFSRPTS